MPRALAYSNPPASGRLLITCVTAPSMRPFAAASITAAMFEPRPEIRIVMRASAMCGAGLAAAAKRPSADDRVWRAVGPRNDFADVERRLARALQRGDGRRDVAGADRQHHADTAVEDTMHLVVRDVALRLQPVENRRARPPRPVHHCLHRFRQ